MDKRTEYRLQAIEKFGEDYYATKVTGIEIEEADVNYAKCSLKINRNHLNAMGFVMGGAIFTLADFAFAIASNTGNPPTVSLTSQINYINATRGPLLYAEANCVKNGRSVCFYNIKVNDDKGNIIADITTTGYRKV